MESRESKRDKFCKICLIVFICLLFSGVIITLIVMMTYAIINDNHTDYYSSVDLNLKNTELISALNILTYNKRQLLQYSAAWEFIQKLYPDVVLDIYSDKKWKAKTGQCSYRKDWNTIPVGTCYVREHIFPRSWFYYENAATVDLTIIFPADANINHLRSNLPYDLTNTSVNIVGACQHNSTMLCFEPADNYKGDLARVYFYVSMAYRNIFECCNTESNNGSYLKPWLEQLLRQWHIADPVSDEERRRTDIIEQFQSTRNPFVDFPNLANQIDTFN